jgi:SAM-dependent methyltransferase
VGIEQRSPERKGEYWDNFYQSRQDSEPPSQFAAFIAQEARGAHIVEVGCGSGRDSIFFARYDHYVTGVDASAEAIRVCNERKRILGLENASFVQASVESETFVDIIASTRLRSHAHSICLYGRFFLHAITDDEQQGLLSAAKDTLTSQDLLAFEYRTVRDKNLEKATAPHFRRYITPTEFSREALGYGFHTEYAVEGFGFSKYRQDDAYVARCILRKSE